MISPCAAAPVLCGQAKHALRFMLPTSSHSLHDLTPLLPPLLPMQVCWANFGGPASRAGDQHYASRHSSSTSARPAAGEAPGRRASTGIAPDSSWQQRTVSLCTWIPGQDSAAAQTPEQHGLLGAPFGAAGAAESGRVNDTGLSPSHLPKWWNNTGSAQSAGGSKPSLRQTPGAAPANLASPAGLETLVDASAASGAGAGACGGDTSSGRGSGSGSTHSGNTSAVLEAALCLLLRTSITCVFASGELLECPLLQPCQALWPLPTGVILAVRRGSLLCYDGALSTSTTNSIQIWPGIQAVLDSRGTVSSVQLLVFGLQRHWLKPWCLLHWGLSRVQALNPR